MLNIFYQVISGDDPAYPDVGIASSMIRSNLENAWESLGIRLDSIFKDYRRGSISKIHSVEIDTEDRLVIIRYSYSGIEDRIITRFLGIHKLVLVD